MATKLQQLATLGQSIWYDHVRRALLDHGDLQALVDAGVTGVTFNLSVLEKAITGSADYDEALGGWGEPSESADEVYEGLVIEDARRGADVLRPVYEESGGADGYVSLGINPRLAHETKGIVTEARRLFARLDRPNGMIQVPATPAGIPAVETLIGEGINVDVTLLFSLDHYDAAAEAYIAGLERRAVHGGDLSRVASVASFFVSRVDTAVDPPLKRVGNEDLRGKVGIANGRVAYARFKSTFRGDRWARLSVRGARVQRLRWASTSVQHPLYSDTLYVDNLIGPDTVSTVSLSTLNGFVDHGTVALTLEEEVAEAHKRVDRLAELGIDLPAIAQQLQRDGGTTLAGVYRSLMSSIVDKRERLLAGWRRREARLGGYQAAVDAALEETVADNMIPRIWAHDHRVWQPEPTEITNRLGWLHIAEKMLAQRDHLIDLAESVRADGYTDVLLLGMGGSSLAPEVFSHVFGGQVAGMPRLEVLDSTDPGAVLAQAERLNPERTLFIVATKSGTTVETLSFFKFFYNWTAQALGAERAGSHFVAITDPGSRMEMLAEKYAFRAAFLNDPHIGGRYSALSYFGLVPAALVGVDVERLLERSLTMARNCEPCNGPIHGDNNGAWLGAVLGELAQAGRDKVTFIISPLLANVGDWMEQLIAESTGKEGAGILPVVGEPVGGPEVYAEDRLFVYLRLDGDDVYDGAVQALQGAGHPVVRLRLRDLYDLGEQLFLWEMATAVAGYRLGINPFNQPNVEAAKVRARQAVDTYRQTGQLPQDQPAPLTAETLNEFLAQAQPGDPLTGAGRSYVALQAFVQPTAETDAALSALRTRIRDTRKLATTVGYGPRFLHSTGQLHKGDAGNGLFIQFTADDPRDAPIPDEAGKLEAGVTFGLLKRAQALGDKQALEDAGRQVIRFHLGSDVVGGLGRLTEALV